MILESLATLALAAVAACAPQNQLQLVADYGPNPTGVGMYVYTPAKLADPLPLIVALHGCISNATNYFNYTQYADLADEHGFIVIYPNAPGNVGCWDVQTNATLTHDAGGDSLSIASTVRYAIWKYGVSPNHIYATGTSVGAAMMSVLMAAYPELFRAGSGFSGAPYGCFAGTNDSYVACAEGKLIKTPQEWGDLVRSAYPGYTGPRPKVQFWHGTADPIYNIQDYWEQVKQWTNVFGVSQTFTSNITNDPIPGYSSAMFGPNVNGIWAEGGIHPLPVRESDVLNWFGITWDSTS